MVYESDDGDDDARSELFARTCRIIQNVNDRQPNIRWYVGEGKLRYRRPYGDEDRVRCRVHVLV